jgi:GUN4-like/Caspase domain
MAKLALLIGVSEYQVGLNLLLGAVKDVDAMQRVLQHSEIGGFNEVKTLTNPDPITMQEAIEALFSNRAKDDLALLFFSGHGVKDDRGRLYFATRLTRKDPSGDLIKSTAVPASFVQDIMSSSRCKRQVVLLDCCFSGAFAEGMTAKDDGTVDVQNQLGGEGRAVLTSSTSTQYSFEQQGSDLSVYTRYIVEGIETGAADTDNDGSISIDELHDYARKKVQETAPAMRPKIYAVEEGFKIRLAQAPIGDPKLKYRKEVEQFANRGEISDINRDTLDLLREQLNMSPSEASEIEAQVLKPFQDYKKKLERYQSVLVKAIQRENPLSESTRADLKRFQEVLGLEDKDVASIAQLNSADSKSEGDINYYKLESFLKQGYWEEADQATAKIMLDIVKREGRDELDEKSLEIFPALDLLHIDKLWRKYSNEKFGFSVQKEIFRKSGKDVKDFAERVGWKNRTVFGDYFSWKERHEITFELDSAPSGPWSWANLKNHKLDIKFVGSFEVATDGSKERIEILFSRRNLKNT